MLREVFRRTRWSPSFETSTPSHAIDLRFVAHAAAVETLQIRLVAHGWIGLFGALLSAGTDLMWLGSGPGGEAEVKRAYSALFGRFFGRAVLRREHNIRCLRQVSQGMTLAPDVILQRRLGAGAHGDLPDWVGWDHGRQVWAVCEAKGSYNRQSNWIAGTPAVIAAALRQVARMEIRDVNGAIASEAWVVGSRWATVQNDLPAVVMTVDPSMQGRVMNADEAEAHRLQLRADWYADLLVGLGRDNLANDLRRPTSNPATFENGQIQIDGVRGYGALIIDNVGLFPLVGGDRMDQLQMLKSFAAQRKQKTAILVLDANAVNVARDRSPDLAGGDGNEAGSISESESIIIQDGIALSWDTDAVETA